jgi:tryptophan-rich sensory protein
MTYAIIHVLVPVLLACALNAYIYMKGWNTADSKETAAKNPLLPPGYVIAIVWIVILALLGYAHFLTYPKYSSWVIVLAIAYCLLYPFLTLGMKSKLAIFNGIALLFAIAVTSTCYATIMESTLYTIPFLLWTVYVNIACNLFDLGVLP